MNTQLRKITILAHGLRGGGGISVGKNLINGITKHFPKVKFQIFVPKDLGYEDSAPNHSDCEWIAYEHKFGVIGRWLYDKTVIVKRIEKFSPNLVLCLGNIGLQKYVAPQILLVQDSHLFYPRKHYSREGFLQNLVYSFKRRHFSHDLERTNVLLCQTTTALHRIKNQYGFSGSIEVFPNAISISSLSGDGSSKNIKIDIQKNDFRLFYLTKYYPHKNIEALLDVFSKYKDELANVTLYLTINANQHPKAKKLLKKIEQKGLSANIINIGPIEQKQIASYFRVMDALIMPSTLESFSGSYLEAMNFDCPVLTSDLDFAREVCRDAALYFDPWAVDSIYNSIRALMDDPQLAVTLRERGKKVLESNCRSWQQNIEQLDSIICKLL